MSTADDLIATIRESVIGRSEMVRGPFGPRPVVYADYTASGRSLSFIEAYLDDVVLPLYANTHTESSGTGLQTTRFREDAREIIRRCVGAGDEHAVLFCGSGSTGAIAKLVGVLGLRIPSVLDDTHGLSAHIPAEERPVVFIGPYEHHSNELPWRESIADVVTIDEDADGHIDLAQLEAELERHAHRPRLIGSFSAASNVTGIVTDTAAVSALLHRFGALALWDFAAAAPYVDIDMGSAAAGDTYYDAIFVSPHKFIGGPGTPGLLVARRELFANRVPEVPAGGTVAYVNPSEHDYLPRDRATGGGRHPRHRRLDPGRTRVPAQGGGGHRRDLRPRGPLRPPRHRSLGGRSLTSRSSEAAMPSGSRSSRSSSAIPVPTATPTPVATCITTSWCRCSTTCSASSRGAGARAPARTVTGCSASTSTAPTSSNGRSPGAARASSPAGCG